MHNGGPFEVRGDIARSLAERHDRVADLLKALGNEARAAIVGVFP